MTSSPITDGPERLFLSPSCCIAPNEGRLWCEDDVWSGECEDGNQGIEYVRADLRSSAPLGMEEMVSQMRSALSEAEDMLMRARDKRKLFGLQRTIESVQAALSTPLVTGRE